MKKLGLFIPAIACLFLSSALNAGEYDHVYRGIRPLGMGGAFVAVSNDQNALFYNPAGLSYVPKQRITLLSVEAELGRDGYDAVTDALDVDTESEQEVASYLRDYIGEYTHAAAAVFPCYIRPHFAFGVFGTARANTMARNYQYPSLVVDCAWNAGAAAGYAHSLLDDSLSIGASVKYVHRESLTGEYTVPDITSDDFDDMLEDDTLDGSGTLLDLGLIYRFGDIPIGGRTVSFQAGISVNNLIGADLGHARDLEEHVDVGCAILVGPWIFALDYFDISGRVGDDDDVGKRLRVGAEYRFNERVTARAGFHQGYPTLGLTIDMRFVQVDFLTYAEEVGTFAGQHDDRRYALGLRFGF